MRHFRRLLYVVVGIVAIVIVAGIVSPLDSQGRSRAAGLSDANAVSSIPQVDMAILEHAALLLDNQSAHTTGEGETNTPHSGYDINAPINSTLLDFQLPGTQPGGLTSPLADNNTCTTCHINLTEDDHIRDYYNGSMMTNGMRDPLFRAALVVSNKDAGFGGELCIRCHSPNAWLNNRSNIPGDPASTDGRLVNAEDLHGISCSSCHRMVPTSSMAGEASGDAAERSALTGPFKLGSSAYIIDRNDVRRGPFDVSSAPHAVAQSSFLQSAEICATCHDIDNPLLTFNPASGEFELNTMNTPVAATDRLFPLDRSYSEWAASQFAGTGVSGLDYPGLKRSTTTTNGPITVCQDCHMPMVLSSIADGGPDRQVGQHKWVGANTSWQDGIIEVWDDVVGDTRFDATQTAANKALGVDLLSRAADLDIAIVNGQLEVKVTNNSGHKLPTGYGEGRRMWLEVYQFKGPGATLVFTSGIMAGVVGPLPNDPFLKKYEIKLGLTEDHAEEIGRPELAGEGFHIILNNKVFKDNRIPPRGFTNEAFAARDMQPVGVTYADGQYWDTTYYPLHPEATAISVRLMYQTASSEYLDFLSTEANFTVSDAVRGDTNWGQIINTLRSAPLNIGKPQLMVASSLSMPRQFVATNGNDAGQCLDSAQPCKTITYALGQATDGGEIRVAAGVYPEEIVVTKQISITGGFTTTNWITPTWTTNQTILDGQQIRRPLTINANWVRVNGFFIRNGNATNSTVGGGSGGGIYIGPVNKAEVATLLNLRLENNVANTEPTGSGYGGGLAAEMGNNVSITGLLTLNNITVINNTASSVGLGSFGGGMRIQAVGNSALDVEMVKVTVQGNTAGNDFSSGGGGISFALRDGTANMRQSVIIGNHAAKIKTQLGGPSFGGGLELNGGTLLLENVLIAGNDGESGDALWAKASSAFPAKVLMNYVTIADNYRVAADAAAAIHVQGAGVTLDLANTLISGNPIAFEAEGNAQSVPLSLASVLIDNNVGTVSTDTFATSGTPLRGVAGYVNAATRNYRLTATSAAVDKGNNQPPLIDLDGGSRPKGAASDIGAYEFTPIGLANQTITFNALLDKLLSDPPFTLSATASSGLPVSFASLTTGICTVSSNTVTLVATGICTIRATQAGNASFNPASPVSRSFNVSTQVGSGTLKAFLPMLKR